MDERKKDKLLLYLFLNKAVGIVLKYVGSAWGLFSVYMYLLKESSAATDAILGFIVAIFGVLLQYIPMGVALLIGIGDQCQESTRELLRQLDKGEPNMKSDTGR